MKMAVRSLMKRVAEGERRMERGDGRKDGDENLTFSLSL